MSLRPAAELTSSLRGASTSDASAPRWIENRRPPPFSSRDVSGAERANGWPIGRRRQAEGVRWQRGHRHRVPGHVEELDGVAFLRDAGYGVSLDDCFHIASTESVLSDVGDSAGIDSAG